MQEKLAYDKLDDSAKFREQYRFTFSVAIIATYFVIPNDNILWQYSSYATGFSALFSAFYLITSAAQLNYRDPGRMYEIFKVSENLRMRAYDWSIHVFAVAFLFFIGIFLSGLLFNVMGVSPQSSIFLLVLSIIVVCLAASFILAEELLSRRKRKSDKALPRV